MKISETGLNLIKQFEGCRLTAYKDSSGIPTIGYGHTKGVKLGQKITQAQADEYLRQDVASAEKAVSKYKYNYNINQFSALVSFTYNCGPGNLKLITSNGTRTLDQISARLPNYNKAGGHVLAGLIRRRAAEKKLFDTPCSAINIENKKYYPAYQGKSSSLVTALDSVGANSSYANRKIIAKVNGIEDYRGTAGQNIFMFNLLKDGKLLKE
jgi:GH24 family phage-related lysozyme (muramidase)